jgi:hypothetical protein
MFACSEQSCTKTFVRYSALVKHCDLGAHTRALERITIYDRAKLSYAQHVQEGQVRERPSIAVSSSTTINRESHVLPMGWALKQSSNKARIKRDLAKNKNNFLMKNLTLVREQEKRVMVRSLPNR